MKEGADQVSAVARVLGRSCSRMYHHACRLVDDRQVVVFVDDIERYFFWNGSKRRSVRRPANRDLLVALQSQRCLSGSLVDQHLTFLDELLHACAADLCGIDFRKLPGEVMVEALPRGTLRDDESYGKLLHREA